MTNIFIVYHSQTGNTEKMALALAEGARLIDDTEVLLRRARDAALDDLKKVYKPVISAGVPTDETLKACRNLGGVLAGGCQMGIF
jgi:NAD(P)H dehydrogenase (quinone)